MHVHTGCGKKKNKKFNLGGVGGVSSFVTFLSFCSVVTEFVFHICEVVYIMEESSRILSLHLNRKMLVLVASHDYILAQV